MVVVPGATGVAARIEPAALEMVATPTLDDDHVTWVVRVLGRSIGEDAGGGEGPG